MPASALSPQLSPEKKVVLHLKPNFFYFARMSYIGRNLCKHRQTIPSYKIVQFLHMAVFFSAVANLLSKNVLALLEDQDLKAMRSHD